MLTREQVIKRLCKLMSEVADKSVGWHHPTPCVCGCNPMVQETDGTDGAALAYIEQVVRASLSRETRTHIDSAVSAAGTAAHHALQEGAEATK